MVSVQKIHSSELPPGEIDLTPYTFAMALDRLVYGVDNLRHDVHLSPGFCRLAQKLIRRSMAKHAQAEDVLNIKNPSGWVKERDEFSRLYRDVLTEAVHQAKSVSEVQIDYLAQTSVFKLIIETVRDQFARTLESFQRRILSSEGVGRADFKETIRLKERLAGIREDRHELIRQVGQEIFGYLLLVQKEWLKPLREANFGQEVVFPEDVYINPLLHVPHPARDDFMLDSYVLIGRRLEDPDRYEALLVLLRELVAPLLKEASAPGKKEAGNAPDNSAARRPGSELSHLDPWLKDISNIEKLLDCFETRNALKRLKKQKGGEANLERLNRQYKARRRRIKPFYANMRRCGLMNRICATYEMASIYGDYSPPLNPRQVLQYLTVKKSRRLIAGHVKAYRKVYGRQLSMGPLRKKARRLRRISPKKHQTLLIRFLKDFVRYHRDRENQVLFSEAMAKIHLVRDKKLLDLSRANKTLYEFLLPHERMPEEKPVIRHVILKADIRGATDLTHGMVAKGLNPASFFSLNFFDPITDILPKYGAGKVFIEGDALILSILEREAEPSGWYCVARACGLAAQILMIIDRYNDRSRNNNLPMLEVGCGINYLDGSPTYLFDGDSRIMISPAINLADRMSGCARELRERGNLRKGLFHLRVFQALDDKSHEATRDDLFIRYNVNGIELNDQGFKKLSKEIRLQDLVYKTTGSKPEKVRLYTGKFPTATGHYQRLVIREGRVLALDPKTFRPIRRTDQKYYEVCTHSDLFEFVRATDGE